MGHSELNVKASAIGKRKETILSCKINMLLCQICFCKLLKIATDSDITYSNAFESI